MSSLHPLLSELIRSSTTNEERGHLLDRMIKEGLLNARLHVPHEGCSLLTWLVENRHSELALRLLAAGADPRDGSDIGYQPLHAAAAFNDRAVCQALIRHGASWHSPTNQGATPVHYALCDDLDPAFVGWMLDQLPSPSHALMKKSTVGVSKPSSAWVFMARYGGGEDCLLEVLKILDERGLIDQLQHSGKPAHRQALRDFKDQIRQRFGVGLVSRWLEARKEGRWLESETVAVPTPAPSRRPRF